MRYIMINCDWCGKETKKQYWRYLQKDETKRYKKTYCSIKCRNEDRNFCSSTEVQCSFCHKKFIKKLCHIKKSKSGRSFCNKSCAASYNNKLKRKTRRSQIEIKFYHLLVKEFPQLTILPNDKIMLDGLEVDVAIPSLDLAIEWNGIVHFKPIYGQTNLTKVQNRDTKKLKIASNKNINLIVIPDLVSNNKTLNQAFDDVKNIIKQLIANSELVV